MGDEERAAQFEAALHTKLLGKPVRFYSFSVTTEALALGWARKEKAAEGATVVAQQELSPRQRKGGPWTPFPGKGLYFSVLLRPGLPPEGEGLLWLMASVGVAEGLESLIGKQVKCKWPDDILVNDRKIGGVKIEAQLGPGEIASAVVTCRINLNVPEEEFPEAIRGTATSTLIETGKELAFEQALDAVLVGIEGRYDDDVPKMMQGYIERCVTVGRNVRAVLMPKGEVAGVATGIDPFGSLQVEVGGRTVPVVIDTLKRLEQI